jgi:hypothetical protein
MSLHRRRAGKNVAESFRRFIMDLIVIGITLGMFFGSVLLITFCDYLGDIK